MAKRVFFSFHYQDVIDFRANVVRNHWMTKPNRENAGFFDASVWEKAKKESDIALKKLINGAISGTSVTAVLIGSNTYQRQWVHYEIFKTLAKGNKLISVHINGIKDKSQNTKLNGPNPFDNLGYYVEKDGKKISPIYKKNGKWTYFSLYPGYSMSPAWKNYREKCVSLTQLGYKTYDWVKNDGYNNFSTWVNGK